MANTWHVDWLREGAVRWNKRRKRVRFSPDLSGIRFFEHLPKDYRDDPKTSRYFEKFDLSGANLERADLSDLNFANSDFTDANLFRADLSKSNFRGAKFVRANLVEAKGFRSRFDGALFEEASLDGLSFFEASLEGVTFVATSLSDAQREEISEQVVRFFASRNDYRAIFKSLIGASPSQSPANKKAEESKIIRYDVYYGTNRKPIIERGALVSFDGNHSHQLHFGLCEVIVPDGHKIGSIGSSLFRKLWRVKENVLRLGGIIPLDQELFWTHLIRTSERMREKARPTIFIHGYNNSFEEAVLRAAQIGHDLGIGQGVGLFSWPSKGKSLSYAADEASAKASKYHLADFLESFVNQGSRLGINVIAHSMGCRVLLGALEQLELRKSSALGEIHQVILAAADVDVNIMPKMGRPAITHSERLTSYVSAKDQALKLSGWLHSFPRVGASPPTFVINGLDTIVVNDMDLGSFGHTYVASSRVIISDIFSILKNGLPPEKRHSLEAVSYSPVNYWRIRH